MLSCDGLIDTGATSTVISRKLAFSLNLKSRSSSEVVIAGRSEFLHSVNVAIWLHMVNDQGQKSPLVVLNRTPVVIGLEEPKFDRVIGEVRTAKFEALIGMDVLEHCDLLCERGGDFQLSSGFR